MFLKARVINTGMMGYSGMIFVGLKNSMLSMVCDGLDPGYRSHLNKFLGISSDLADCQSKCIAYG